LSRSVPSGGQPATLGSGPAIVVPHLGGDRDA